MGQNHVLCVVAKGQESVSHKKCNREDKHHHWSQIGLPRVVHCDDTEPLFHVVDKS